MNTKLPTIFGIDLGTTYSCIAYVDEHGQPTIIPNSKNEASTPSVVLFDGVKKIVGTEALNQAAQNPDDVVAVVKRAIGKSKQEWSFHNQDAEEISAEILRQVAKDAWQSLKVPVKDVVITVPAYFGIAEREATERAGKLAGLNVRGIINEPTAAAIMYDRERYLSKKERPNEVALVYDLGGGTFDVSIIEIAQKGVNVIVTGGDRKLGGYDWDEALVRYLVDEWKKSANVSQNPRIDALVDHDLHVKAENAKRILSEKDKTSVTITYAQKSRVVPITRNKFNEITAHLLARTLEFTRDTIEFAAKERGYSKIDKILLVGGSSRMPQVRERLALAFPDIPIEMHDPDEAVAKGAAFYAYKLAIDAKIEDILNNDVIGRLEGVDRKEVAINMVAEEIGIAASIVQEIHQKKIINVISHSFGVVTVCNYGTPQESRPISNLILANTPLPASARKEYATVKNNQQAVLIEITETLHLSETVEPEDYSEENKIGRYQLTPLPPNLPAGSTIEVQFEINQYGLLYFEAREVSSGVVIDGKLETSDMKQS